LICARSFDAVVTNSRVCCAVRGGRISGPDTEVKEGIIFRKFCMAGTGDRPY
jgi:hypothetical protein